MRRSLKIGNIQVKESVEEMCSIILFVQEIKIKILVILKEIGLLDRVEYEGSVLFNYSYA